MSAKLARAIVTLPDRKTATRTPGTILRNDCFMLLTELSPQGVVEIPDQILRTFDPDRNADGFFGDPGSFQSWLAHRSVAHGPGVLNERFHPAQGFGETKIFQTLEQPGGRALFCVQLKGQHPAEPAHLFFDQGILWVAFKTWIINFLDMLVLFQMPGDGQGVGLMSFHAGDEGLDPAQDQPRVEGRFGNTQGVDPKAAAGFQVLVPVDDRSADNIAVTVQIFGRGVDDNVRSKIKRTLKIRTQKRIIHDRQDLPGPGKPDDALQIDDI